MKHLFTVFNTQNPSFSSITFDEFLVGVGICYVKDKIDDAILVMFDGANFGNDNKIEKKKYCWNY